MSRLVIALILVTGAVAACGKSSSSSPPVSLRNRRRTTRAVRPSTELGNVDEQLAPGDTKTIIITAHAGGHATDFGRFHQGQGMQGAVYIG